MLGGVSLLYIKPHLVRFFDSRMGTMDDVLIEFVTKFAVAIGGYVRKQNIFHAAMGFLVDF